MKPYRGIPINGKNFVYGDLIRKSKRAWIVIDFEIPKSIKFGGMQLLCNSYEVIPDTLGLCLLRKDVNNKTIYELDDVKVVYRDKCGFARKEIGIVEIYELRVILNFPQYGVIIPMDEFDTDDPADFEIVANEIESPGYALNINTKR